MGLFSCCTNNVIENVVTETIQTPLPPGSISGPVHPTVLHGSPHCNLHVILGKIVIEPVKARKEGKLTSATSKESKESKDSGERP